MGLQLGDIVVSNVSATTNYAITIVGERSQLQMMRHDQAIAHARALGEQRKVDVWLTEDRLHFMPLALHRSAAVAS